MNEQQANQLFEQAISALHAGKASEAEKILKKLDSAIPSNPGIIYYLGITASLQGRKEQAVSIYDRVIRLHPEFVEAYNNKGLDLDYLGNHKDAVKQFRLAINMRPDFAEAYQNLGASLNHMKLYEEAAQNFLMALRLRPNYGDAMVSMAGALIGLKRFTEAEQMLNNAIQKNPQDAKAYYNFGMLFFELKDYGKAVAAYKTSIECKPDFSDAYESLGAAHAALREYSESIAALTAALKLGSKTKWIHGSILHTKMKICEWFEFDGLVGKSLSMDGLRGKSAAPFTLLGLPSSRIQQRLCSETYVASEYPFPHPSPKITIDYCNKKIKIAYLSADYYSHATIHLMDELFELHNRDRFEVIGICYSRSPQDAVRAQVATKFDHFFELGDKTDTEIAEVIRSLKIDIAIDLKGHTQDSRLGIFALRPAPVQVHYLGYPGTTGADFIDYLVADKTLIPEEHLDGYTEKIIYLPDTYQANSRKVTIAEISDSRADHGLPQGAFVFCSFNNNWKITPDLFDVWMNILKQVEGSVLWLFRENEIAGSNLMREAESRGVRANRLVFANKLPINEHLARHRHANLFLDTIYCNAHTTASDALRADLPVLTKLGDTYAGRVAGSLLKAMGLPELITHSLKEYEALAIELATNPKKLSALKRKLVANRVNTSLFDTPKFTRSLESAYEIILARYKDSLKPDHIYVSLT